MGRHCLRCGDAIPRFSGFWGVRYILGGQHFRFSSDVLTKNVLGTTKFEGNKNFGGRHARMLPVATGLRYGRMHLCLFCKRQTQHTANVVEPHATLCTYSFFWGRHTRVIYNVTEQCAPQRSCFCPILQKQLHSVLHSHSVQKTFHKSPWQHNIHNCFLLVCKEPTDLPEPCGSQYVYVVILSCRMRA